MQIHLSDKDIQNIYALTVKDEEIYIDNAISGKNGYYCLGCKREMQAVKGQVRRPYFRHDVEANKTLGKCTYSDETYRHKLAKDQLQLTKRIKVPPIYKFAPDGSGQAMLVSNSKFVEAHRVANELQFYEDDNGEIKWGRNLGEVRNLLIQPDVTFFDANDNPILFIEIVATHKLTTEKLTKILRLGIDTVTVTIPKDSPESIAETFNQITRTNWIYSNEQQAAEYIRVSEGHTEEILSLTEEQRRNFKLTIRCRQAEIRDLIFRIRRCLESEQFRTINESNKRELQRVEENTDELRTIIRKQSERDNKFLIGEQEREIEDFRTTRETNQSIIDRIKLQHKNLERSYIDKEREIETKQGEINRASRERFETGERERKDFENVISELERQEISIDEATRESERNIIDANENNGSRRGNSEERATRNSENKEREYRRGKEAIEQIERDIARELANRDEAFKRYENRRSEFGRQYDEFCKSSVEAVERKDFSRFPQLNEGYEATLSGRGLLLDFKEKERLNTRYRSIREFLISGAFKIWLPKS